MPQNNRHSYLQLIKEKINKEYRRTLKIADLASDAGISESKLQHDFSAVFGLCIQDYHIQVRVAVAKDMIENTNYSMKYIGILTGYKNPESFTRAFKKATGVRPSQYRDELE